MIEDRRWLLSLFGAATLTPVLVFAAALAGALTWVGVRAGGGGAAAVAWAAAGVVYWTFVEYALHRWLYHWTPRNRALRRIVESFHVYHHRTPDDRAVWNAGPALVVLLTTLLSLPPLMLLGGVAPAAFVMLGAVVAYAIYEVVHHECHARVHTRGPLVYLQAFHLRHHQRNWRRNFGVTNPFWDWLFGTLAPTGDRVGEPAGFARREPIAGGSEPSQGSEVDRCPTSTRSGCARCRRSGASRSAPGERRWIPRSTAP